MTVSYRYIYIDKLYINNMQFDLEVWIKNYRTNSRSVEPSCENRKSDDHDRFYRVTRSNVHLTRD